MSLRLKLVLLFAAVLASTMGLASWLGGRIAQTSIEAEIRERTLETGRAFVADLALAASYDAKSTNERLAQLLRGHRGLRAAELAVERPGPDQIIRVELTGNGPRQEVREGQADVPEKPTSSLITTADGRVWSISLRAKVGRSRGRLTLEASLAEADSLVAAERSVFFWVTAGACGLLVFLVHLMLVRVIGRPIEALAEAMRQAEHKQLDVPPLVPTSNDELATLAHGFNAMIGRIRGFNRELQERVDQAVADQARINDLLVATRRDLTAKERLAALGQLAGTLAHELGNPLNAISGHVQLLARAPDLPEPAREDLRLVQSEIARMTGIIRRFLDSTRAMTPRPEPVDVAALVDEAVDLSLSAEARGRLRVEREVGPGLEAVVLDPGLVRHVLTNFIANAVDAMPEGGDLAVRAARAGEELALSVRDTGKGIAPEDRPRIFEPFFTTKQQGKGTGLGLAICREIARALKGRVEVDSAPDQGSTFTLFVPAPAAVAQADRRAG